MENLPSASNSHENMTKDSMSGKCILDTLLTQPVSSKPLDYMRAAYAEYTNPHLKLSLEQQASLVKSIVMEHCYARPYSWRSESNFLRPTKLLLNEKTDATDDIENIDVVTVPEEPPPIYDVSKAKRCMEECEKHVMGIRDEDYDEDWTSKVPKYNWTDIQHQIYEGVITILTCDRMARLACEGSLNEAVLRRNIIEKSVQSFRKLLAKFSWELKLVQWLHQTLLDNLSTTYLGEYLDILQTLRNKVPGLVDKLIHNPNAPFRMGPLNIDNLFPLLKRRWDPVASNILVDKTKKIPGSPVLILVPSTATLATNSQSKRLKRWINYFSAIATVATVHSSGRCGRKMSMMNCIDQMFAATRARVQEVKAEYPSRSVVLVGFNSGASLALQVAQVENVLSVVCLGFSVYTAEGNRGDPDDNLLELHSPIMFVIGQCSNTSLQEHLEDIRERMRVETALLVVGGADDYLRVKSRMKRSNCVTQSMIDRTIVQEVGDFISGLVLSPYPPQIRQSPSCALADPLKRPKAERKRNTSNCSSLDSEPPSPTARIHRPVGRPPGSKAKSKIEAKWHAMQQGTINNDNNTTNSSIPPSPSPTESVPESPDTKSQTPTPNTSITTSNAKLQAMGMTPNRGYYQSGGPLSNLITPGGVRTLPPNPNKQIKVLDNISITPANKMLQMNNRPMELNKQQSHSPMMASSSGAYNNIMLMPDGRYKGKSGSKPIKDTTSETYTLTELLTNTKKAQQTPSAMKKGAAAAGNVPINKKPASNSQPNHPKTIARLNKYITSKKQLLANRSQKQMKKMSPFMGHASQTLPPPANLTTQDIMDLPIIFADDNQVIATPNIQQQQGEHSSLSMLPSKEVRTSGGTRKFVFVNKQPLKRPASDVMKGNTIKYAKIIISKADDKKATKVSTAEDVGLNLKVNPVGVPMDSDLEEELKGSAIRKIDSGVTLVTESERGMTSMESSEEIDVVQVASDTSVSEDMA